MEVRPKYLPPMSSLRPFEAAARLLSFSRAADEINVTQAAVSKQIRALETSLGQKLFLRKGQKVELTINGQILHQAVSHGLSHISRATAQISRDSRLNRISIAMRLPFASQFMASRLSKLRNAFPDLDFNIVATERNPFFLLDSVEMAVVLGFEPQPGLLADYLLTEEIFPVCSPGYVRRHPELRTIQDIPDQKLLHLDAEHWRDLDWDPVDWPVFGREMGIDREIGTSGPSFNNHELLLSAAVSGLGLAIGWRHLSRDLLEEGHLVRPLRDSYRIDRKHFLITHAIHANDSMMQDMRAWFVAETACFRTDD